MDAQKYTGKKFIADSLVKVGNYLVDYFRDEQNEEFCIMLLDSSLKSIEFRSLGKGSANSAALDVKTLVKYAIIGNASYVILAHNHPSGIAMPSKQDRQTTSEVEMALSAVGIMLLEHIIVSGIGYKPTMHVRAFNSDDTEHSTLYKKFYNGV